MVSFSGMFGATFAFKAPSLDPYHICTHFVTTILEYWIFSQEPLFLAFQRAGKFEVLRHASCYLARDGDIYRMRAACLRREPNGEEIRCCQQIAKYQKRRHDVIFFRCKESNHRGTRTFAVHLLPTNSTTLILGTGRDRCIIDQL